MNKDTMTGPCCICGLTNYSPSMGGPTICPKCDCGMFDAATVMQQAKVIEGLRAELVALAATQEQRGEPGQWRILSETPDEAVQVEFYYGKITFLDQDGRFAPPLPPYRDERRELGYWDGWDWHHCGTGHRINEFGDDAPDWIPTHWRPLPPPPTLTSSRGKQETNQ